MLRLNLPPQTMTDLRFAYSPLLELTISFRVLRGEWERSTYWRWLDEALRATADADFPYMERLITPGRLKPVGNKTVPVGYIPDFLTPTPVSTVSDIEHEFEQLLATPHALIQENVQYLINLVGPDALLCDFLAYPAAGMQALVAELRDYWQRTLAHHWHRMLAVLENDILYHSRILMLDGIRDFFPTLHGQLGYDGQSITLDDAPVPCDPDFIVPEKPDKILTVDGDRFNIVPVIFAAHGVYFQVSEPWLPMIIYTPRGAGLWNYETPEPSQALELVIGAGKSRILMALETPFSTGELARKLSLTSGAVSQQLGKLHQAGLVESHRSGKHVFYRLSQRGVQLVSLFN